MEHNEVTTAFADSISSIAWQLTALWVVMAAMRTSNRLFPGSQGASRALHTSVLAITYCLVGMTVVGALGLIERWTVLLSITLTACLADRLIRPVAGVAEVTGENRLGPKLLWTAAASLLAGHVIRNGFHRWPSDWDTLMYHLPFMDHWIQTGSLTATESARWSMPATSELLGLAFVAPFSGDYLVALNNVPAIIVWAAATIELGRSMGMSGWWPHLTALSCLFVQTTVRQSVDASNDLMVAAFFLAGIVYLLRHSSNQRTSDAILLGMCLGILASVKYFAIGYAFLLFALFALTLVLHRRRGNWRRFALAAVSATFCGSYWYARNWIMTGYPLYPIGTTDLSQRLPYPDLRNTMLVFHLTPLAFDLVIDAVWRLCGPLHLTALVAFPAITIALVWQAAVNKGSLGTKNLIMLLSLIGSLFVVLVTPMLVEDQPGTMNHLRWGYTTVRYGLCFLSCVVIALFMGACKLIQTLPRRQQVPLLGLAALLTCLQVVYCLVRIERFDVADALVIAGCIGATAWLFDRCRSVGAVATAGAGALIGLAVLLETVYLSQRWHTGLAHHFNRYHHTSVFTQLSHQPARMLILDERSYPYFGSRRENYIMQPMLFYGVEDVKSRMQSANLEIVATYIENEKTIARYRPAWELLKTDGSFVQYPSKTYGKVLLFKRATP